MPVNNKSVAVFVRAALDLTDEERRLASEILRALSEPEPEPAAPAKPKPKPKPAPLPCALCDRIFLNAHGLKVHIGRVHKTRELFPQETKR